MKLDKQQIQFIDTYLKNSNVEYVDTRQEMLDHIASGIEEKMSVDELEFYDAFKNYMVIHKTEILKNNRKPREFYWDVIKEFAFFLVKPIMLVVGLLMFLVYQNIDVNQYFTKDFTINNLFFVIVLSLSLLQAAYFKFYLKKRFYAVEKTGTILLLIYYGQLGLLPIYGKEKVSIIALIVFSYLFFGYILFLIKAIQKFNKHRFNYI